MKKHPTEFAGKFKFTQLAPLEQTVLKMQRAVSHPPADNWWFRLRDRVSEWVAPPMPLNTWTDITVNSSGKVRVRAESQR